MEAYFLICVCLIGISSGFNVCPPSNSVYRTEPVIKICLDVLLGKPLVVSSEPGCECKRNWHLNQQGQCVPDLLCFAEACMSIDPNLKYSPCLKFVVSCNDFDPADCYLDCEGGCYRNSV